MILTPFRRATAIAIAVVVAAGLGPVSSATAEAPDTSAPGPHAVTKLEYDAQVTPVQFNGLGAPVPYLERLRGTVHFPSTGGPWPAVVFLHGRHSTCRAAGSTELLAPCPDVPPVVEDLPSWRGFNYLASNLASHGYVVMSINANMINMVGTLWDGTDERIKVIHDSLTLLGQWNAGARTIPDGIGSALVGRVDMSRLGLMGHSRGASAVTEFLIRQRSATPGTAWPGLRAVLALQTAVNFSPRAPFGAHFGSIVSSCDGDVGEVGAGDWDRGRFRDPVTPFARVQFMVTGASHNYFNSEWPDEWDERESAPSSSFADQDEACSHHRPKNIRLTRSDQQLVGIALIGAFFRRYLGGDEALDPYMTGAKTLPAGACPTGRVRQGRPVPSAEVVKTSYLAPTSERNMLFTPGDNIGQTDEGLTVTTSGFDYVKTCGTGGSCLDTDVLGDARRVGVAWSGPASVRIPLGPAGRDASGYRALTFRAALMAMDTRNDGIAAQDVEIELIDAHGNRDVARASEFSKALVHPPINYPGGGFGSDYRGMVMNGVRIPLDAFGTVDLANLRTLRLVFGEATPRGAVVLNEIAFQEN